MKIKLPLWLKISAVVLAASIAEVTIWQLSAVKTMESNKVPEIQIKQSYDNIGLWGFWLLASMQGLIIAGVSAGYKTFSPNLKKAFVNARNQRLLNPLKDKLSTEENRETFLGSFAVLKAENGAPERDFYPDNTIYATSLNPRILISTKNLNEKFDFPEIKLREKRYRKAVYNMLKADRDSGATEITPIDWSNYFNPRTVQIAQEVDPARMQNQDPINFADVFFGLLAKGDRAGNAALKALGHINPPGANAVQWGLVRYSEDMFFAENRDGAWILSRQPFLYAGEKGIAQLRSDLPPIKEGLIRYIGKHIESKGDVFAFSARPLARNQQLVALITGLIDNMEERVVGKNHDVMWGSKLAAIMSNPVNGHVVENGVHKGKLVYTHERMQNAGADEYFSRRATSPKTSRFLGGDPAIPNSQLVRHLPVEEAANAENNGENVISISRAITEAKEFLDHTHTDLLNYDNGKDRRNTTDEYDYWPDPIGTAYDQQNLTLLMDLRMNLAHLPKDEVAKVFLAVPSLHGDVGRKIYYTLLAQYIALNDAKVLNAPSGSGITINNGSQNTQNPILQVVLPKSQHMPFLEVEKQPNTDDTITYTIAIPDGLFVEPLKKMAAEFCFEEYNPRDVKQTSARLKQAYQDVIAFRNDSSKWGHGILSEPGSIIPAADLAAIRERKSDPSWDVLTKRLHTLAWTLHYTQKANLANDVYEIAVQDKTLEAAFAMASEVLAGKVPTELTRADTYTNPGRYFTKNIFDAVRPFAENDITIPRKWEDAPTIDAFKPQKKSTPANAVQQVIPTT